MMENFGKIFLKSWQDQILVFNWFVSIRYNHNNEITFQLNLYFTQVSTLTTFQKVFFRKHYPWNLNLHKDNSKKWLDTTNLFPKSCYWRDIANFVVTGHVNLNEIHVNNEEEKWNKKIRNDTNFSKFWVKRK